MTNRSPRRVRLNATDPNDPNAPTPGSPVAQFVCDGLGRLIRQSTHLDADAFVETDLYYDGVRRISEQSQEREQAVPPLQGMFEMLVQTVGDPITVDVWDELEYVWDGSGIGASGGYVDEIAFVLTDDKSVRYALLDANYNLMGWMRPNGGVMFQYVYGPYGDLRAADKQPTLADFPPMAIGHQGLFFVRLDGAPGDPPLTVGAKGLYYNRNRWYSPELGRFTTCDVNETAMPILTTYAFNGSTLTLLIAGFNGQLLYTDGMNLYVYAGSNPLRARDPLGLSWWDDDLDSFIDDHTGWRIGAIGTLSEGARWASVGIDTAVTMAISLIPGSSLLDLYNSGDALLSGDAGLWDYVTVAGGMFAGGAAVMKAFKWGREMAQAGNFMGKSKMSRMWGRNPCNCFVAGTLIDTPEGVLPIENVEVGDAVSTRHESGGSSPRTTGVVTRIFRRIAPAILWMTLASGETLGVTEGHEIWTHQVGWVHAAKVVPGDTLLGLAGEPVEIVDITLDPTPTVVYNFEVDGTFTYYADGVWVHNNSCPIYSSWTVARREYWKTMGLDGPPKAVAKVRYPDGSTANISVTMELHHIDGRDGPTPHSFDNLAPMWPWQHAQVDPHRHLGYTFLGFWD